MLLTPLELPGWLEFNVWRTGLKARRFSFAVTPGGPEIRAVLYLDQRGRVKMPLNNPYLPVAFQSARQGRSGRTADWLRAAAPLVEEIKQRGIANGITLPPEVDDVRPWTWRDFLVRVRYSYYIDFPFDPTLMDRKTRKTCDKAATLGMSVDRVVDVGPVMDCLSETEARKGFSHGLGHRELEAARDLLGPDGLRMYACFDRQGQPGSSLVVVHAHGGRAVGWLAGTSRTHLADGAVHLLWRHAFADLASAGATGIDLCGANIESIAAFKSHWGARLVPYFAVRSYSVRAGARFLADWRHSRQGLRTG
jgi:Acetyltransferase (GNAT) domain